MTDPTDNPDKPRRTPEQRAAARARRQERGQQSAKSDASGTKPGDNPTRRRVPSPNIPTSSGSKLANKRNPAGKATARRAPPAVPDNPIPVILHIGGHKTGSSTIQSLMRGQFSDIDTDGADFFYPLVFNNYRGQHSDLSRLIRTGLHDEMSDAFATIEREHAKAANKTVVLSGEDLSTFSVKEIDILNAALLARRLWVTKVVFFYRPREQFIRSSLIQHMKGDRYFVTPQRFAERIRSYSHDEIIARFATVFGRDAVTAVELVSGSNAVAMFGEATGIPLAADEADDSQPRKNKSLDFGVACWANSTNLTYGLEPGIVQRVSDRMDWPAAPVGLDLSLNDAMAILDGAELPEIDVKALGEKRGPSETVAYLRTLSEYFAKLATEIQERNHL